MAEIQPLLIFDPTAILATQSVHWQEWDRFGRTVLPRAVMEELQGLTHRAEDATQESTAREFLRFSPASDYWISTAKALVTQGTAEDLTLSKRARLEQAVAECAYALSQQQVGTLVVLVSNGRALITRIAQLQIANLCGISVAELLQWHRHKQRPAAVELALKTMPGPPIPASTLAEGMSVSEFFAQSAAQGLPDPDQSPGASPQKPPKGRSRPAKPRAQAARSSASSRPRKHPVLATVQILFNLGLFLASLSLLTASALVAWRVADRQGSEPIWQWLQLPEIPGLYPESTQESS